MGPVEADQLRAWLQGYVRAWRTNDPEDIAALFTEDAAYRTAPHRDPWRGREAIVRSWLDNADEDGTWSFEGDVLATCGDLGFVEGRTAYSDPPPRSYRNLWVIRLDGDRCAEFTEWYVKDG
jgi:ketosteroid isomerase-like protein